MKSKIAKLVASQMQEGRKGRAYGLIGVCFDVKREGGDGRGGEEFEDMDVIRFQKREIHSRYMQLVPVPASERSG